ILLARFEKALFQRDGDVLWKADADETAGGDRVAVMNQLYGFPRGDDLSLLEIPEPLQQFAPRSHRVASCRFVAIRPSAFCLLSVAKHFTLVIHVDCCHRG